MGQAGNTDFVRGVVGLTINATYDASVTSAANKAEIEHAITVADQFFQSVIKTNITVNIDFGFGELDHGAYTIGADALAEALPNGGVNVTYTALRAALAANATSADDATALASLTKNPTGNGTFYVPGAEAKALGLVAANGSGIDGYVGISNANPFNYDPNNRNASGLYDAIGTIEHEVAHVLGRVAGLQADAAGQYTPLDLFRYASAGQRQLTDGQPGYFSINGGATNLNPFDSVAGGDSGDWASSVQNDSFGYGSAGQTGFVTRTDLREMDILGYALNLPTDTAAQLVSAYAAAPTLAYASISDTAAQFSAALNSLAPLAAPAIGAIASTTLSDAATSFVSVAAAQINSDRAALATIATPYSLSVALSGTAISSTATSNLVDFRLTGSGAANIAGNAHANTFMIDNAGNDTIHGGGGSDTVSYSGFKTPGIVATIAGGVGTVVKGGGHGTDKLSGVYNIVGSAGNDRIHLDGTGSAWAMGGNDVITSIGKNAGATDHLYAGSGNDTLTTGPVGTHYEYGSSGHTVFNTGGGTSYIATGTGVDVIMMAAAANVASVSTVEVTGFQHGVDMIGLHQIGVTAANVDSLVHITQGSLGAQISATVGGHTETIILDGISASSLNLHSADFLL